MDRRRSQLARQHRDLCRRLTAARIEQADAEGALAVAQRWAEMDPLDDEAHHHIIGLLAETGRRSEALRHYEGYRELIARELEVEPLEDTQELVARLRAGATTAADLQGPVESPPSPGEVEALSLPSPPAEVYSEAQLRAAVRREEQPATRRVLATPRGQGLLLGSLVTILVVGMLLLWGGARNVPPADSAEESASLDPRAIAVLPFVNLSADPEKEYFSDGITEDLLTSLSRIQDLRVISRTSVMRYKRTEISIGEIARELGVRYFLEGSVRREGNQVCITAQLIDAASDAHLWAETYDRQLLGIFQIQSEIAQRSERLRH